ncbi:MAG: cysteine rich repeat-containing protein [Rhizobiaceae bacterium]
MLVHSIKCLCAIFLMLVVLGMVGTPSTRAQGLLEACEQDIDQFCTGVTPGDGRIMSCLYSREDQVTDQCNNAMEDFGDIIDAMFSTIQNALAICGPDIEKLCAGTKFGEGRMLTCLSENNSDVQPQCQAVVTQFANGLSN